MTCSRARGTRLSRKTETCNTECASMHVVLELRVLGMFCESALWACCARQRSVPTPASHVRHACCARQRSAPVGCCARVFFFLSLSRSISALALALSLIFSLAFLNAFRARRGCERQKDRGRAGVPCWDPLDSKSCTQYSSMVLALRLARGRRSHLSSDRSHRDVIHVYCSNWSYH